MTSLRTRGRAALVDLIGRVLTGERMGPSERSRVEAEIALSGFRKAARAHLFRRMTRSGVEQGEVTIHARVLGGLFAIACSGTDSGVGWEILERGTYEPHVVEFYRRTLKPGMVVADVGANIGFHALHAAALVAPGGRVVAVEPDPRSASLLRLSLALNEGRLPVEVIEAALSDFEEQLVHSDLGNAANSGARFTHRDRGALERLVHGADPQFREVRAIRWDDHHADLGLDLVKIDIEGFEPHAMKGMEASVARHRPVILSEFAPSNLRDLGDTEPSEYLDWFARRDYRCSILDEGTADEVPAPFDEVAARLGDRHHLDLVMRPGA